jgi:ribosome maturation factor RimP
VYFGTDPVTGKERRVKRTVRTEATYQDAEGNEARVATTVPQHQGDIPVGTLRAIERDMRPAFGRGG